VDAYKSERDALLKDFGAKLRELREPRFAKREQFAKASTLNRVHVYYLEHGMRDPSLTTLLVLRDTLKVSLDELTGHLHAPKHRRPPPHRGKREQG
jgi:transcriptional regulator with XRE-family HTH domain